MNSPDTPNPHACVDGLSQYAQRAVENYDNATIFPYFRDVSTVYKKRRQVVSPVAAALIATRRARKHVRMQQLDPRFAPS